MDVWRCMLPSALGDRADLVWQRREGQASSFARSHGATPVAESQHIWCPISVSFLQLGVCMDPPSTTAAGPWPSSVPGSMVLHSRHKASRFAVSTPSRGHASGVTGIHVSDS